ncbi:MULTISPECIES: YppG family protein [Mesobacillus]|uniref:Spore coat protein n=2 Tax=Mesobacillus TaxID=2675231 RepID=A0A0D6ZC79_9BACI|nr:MULTISPECIES: YppG family protein [Mesobacillus]KIY22208.1 hypothetical protein UB32_09405 [Mesobacillus subterraneus]MDQ0412067.1 hypothetical protein [Mesobacillus stamsii]
MFGPRNKMNPYQPHWQGYQNSQETHQYSRNNQSFNRQQPIPQQYTPPYWNAAPGNWQNYYPQQGYPVNPYLQGNNPQWKQSNPIADNKNNYTKMLFQNPLIPEDDPIYGSYNPQADYQNYNPYPQQSFMPKQTSSMQSIMNSFKSQDGNFDFTKMVDTAGMMMNAVTQVSSLVKGLGGIFKV